VVEAALLPEAGWKRLMDVVWLVRTPTERARERVMMRDGLSAEATEARRNGIGCLCLSLGATNDADTLTRVFGTAAHAAAPQFDDLIPDLGRLFRRAIASADLQRRLAQRQRRSAPVATKGAA
jgi:hypothetical protein